MITQLYIINGRAGVGKDSFIRMYNSLHKTLCYSSITLVKQIGVLCGVGEEVFADSKLHSIYSPENEGLEKREFKTEEVRLWWSDMKDFLIEHGDIPFKDTVKHVDIVDAMEEKVTMFLIVRESSEIKKLQQKYPTSVTILVENENEPNTPSNSGDNDVYNANYDIIVKNNGSMQDLLTLAKKVYDYVEVTRRFHTQQRKIKDFRKIHDRIFGKPNYILESESGECDS